MVMLNVQPEYGGSTKSSSRRNTIFYLRHIPLDVLEGATFVEYLCFLYLYVARVAKLGYLRELTTNF